MELRERNAHELMQHNRHIFSWQQIAMGLTAMNHTTSHTTMDGNLILQSRVPIQTCANEWRPC